ncbi:unnamed protein product [Adineta ricciae]|uniref:Uncharacterized protein n=1 Tax=Adineta ricciae TaxID=249248 RepID=A0A815DGH7_ADIRI|nr:unnamed protein product [Adineta ricciae]CAF1293323.1 unnamed protein product [Adineta ricciae]
MSNVTDSSSMMNETLLTSTMKSNDGQDKILIIVLSVVLPTVLSLGLLSLFLVCYRRRLAKLWLKRHDNSSRLESFDSSVTSNYDRSSKQRISHRQFLHPRTETIVYNQINSPSIPTKKSPPEWLPKGQTNAAFDEYIIENEEQSITFNQKPLPQSPVPTITSEFVQAIATHRLSLKTEANKSPNPSPPTVLLFSQRTQF